MIKPKVHTKGNWLATEALRKALAKADGAYFSLGVHNDAGSYPKRQKRDSKGRFSGLTTPPEVHQVAWWLEKGTEHMPARPFLQPAVEENLGIIKEALATGLAGIAFHEWTVSKGLQQGAAICLTLVQNKVKSNVGPALSGSWDPPSGYLGWKRENQMGQRTLIATGLLYRSIGYKLMDRLGNPLKESTQPEAPEGAHEPTMVDHSEDRAKAREEGKKMIEGQKELRKAFKQARGASKSQRGVKKVSPHRATNRTARINKPKH